MKVLRKSDLGYMLTDGGEEILLHYKEATSELSPEQMIDVYVYTDKENRKTGTMAQPNLRMGKPNFVQVVNRIDGVGVFVDNHTPKDLLISKDYLPYELSQWPVVGDMVFCEIKLKKNSLVAKPVNRFDVLALHSETAYQETELVSAYVLRVAEKGLGLITNDLVYVFVPNAQFRGTYRLGEAVLVTITKMLDGEAYGSLNEHKERLMDTDKETILSYLKEHNGKLPLTAKSSSEEVERFFQMSRKAFKRAYGALYKEHLIDFDENNTYLKKL
ncbi:MAG: hypothetical protein K2N64_05500 [Anaeroplasmataceae bacterium]|nr:hypothetical protein [Anaeroplasmataceae bacterium]